MNVIEQVRQHDAYHAEDATRECGDQCEFEPTEERSAIPMTDRERLHFQWHQEDLARECGSACRFEATIDFLMGGDFIAPDPKLCPVRVQSSLQAYVRGLPPGDFVRAVLSNDLNGAIARADDVNIHALPNIVAYVREHLPAVAWGSSEKVNRWLSKERDSTRATRGCAAVCPPFQRGHEEVAHSCMLQAPHDGREHQWICSQSSADSCPCGETHKTHPTRPGAVGWTGHACQCASCLLPEREP